MGYEPDKDNGAKEFELPPKRREQRQLAVNVALRKMLIDANLHLKPAKAVRVKVKVGSDEGYWWMIAMAYRGKCEEQLLLEAVPSNENKYRGYAIPLDVFWDKVREMGYDLEDNNGVEIHRLPQQLAINAALRQLLIDANLYLKPAKAVLVKMKDEDDKYKEKKKKKTKRSKKCYC
ncbi:hypothetical protein BJ138DRAFT_1120038 [Hygrophoropsis aurantiaca]|uniref:Uncharacterized protein n=1 Tax=Hygrophoropsis aurantiaca TaxID=72124 RepID=A0ACB7ZRT4_9AGAM|nr:hypothetical protein BJ138DRAFT_1120038 [Hygrophoropsis aurantiaca]